MPKVDFACAESIAYWLEHLFAEIAGFTNLDRDQDFFEAGLDSLQVIKIARELKFQLKKAGVNNSTEFPPKSIYSHPTLDQLTLFVLQGASLKRSTDGFATEALIGPTSISPKLSSEEGMKVLLESYIDTLPRATKVPPPPSTDNMTVVLTGSTGSVGSYLLDTLYANKKVAHVICLNRNAHAADIHNQTGPKRGLSSLDPERVEFFKANLSQPELGLSREVYERMLKTVTHVIRK